MNVAVENYARIKSTLSICPTCLESIEADVVERDGQVWMHKNCPTHGDFSALLASDARHYYQSNGSAKAGGSCCGVPSSNSALSNHSCTVLIEICERCNLTCPTCFAGSSPAHSRMMDLETYQARIDGLVATGKQTADVIQLSGGEPTIHPQLIDILKTTFASGFLKVTINSNGIKLAQDEFIHQLSECVSAFPDAKLYIYLQFDGFEDRTHAELRGRSDLLELKRRALVNCIRAGFIVHPVMTLTRGINDHEVGDFVSLAMDHPEIKHVVIQPAMYSGRYEHARRMDRLTLADAVALVVDQFGFFSPDDFGPIPCSHPNCHGVAVAVRTDSGLVPVSRYFPRYQDWEAPEAQNLIAAFTDTLNGRDGFAAAMQWVMDDQRTADSLQGLDDETVEVLLDAMASGEPGGGEIWDRMLTVSIKPFMDAWTYDQDRINKCCVHILDEDGTPISLCEYNAVTRPQQTLQGGSYA